MTETATGPTILPATMWQQYVLDEACNPACPDDLRNRLVLAQAFLVRPGIDTRRLGRAFKRLRQRHDTLRIRFHQIKGRWRAVFDDEDRPVLRSIALGDVDDATFQARITDIANAPMPLVDSPLVEVCVVSCGARGDVVITRVHHVLTDGFGMIVLAEDLAKFMLGIPVTGTPVSHADYLTRFQYPSPRKMAENEAFWRELHTDIPQAPDVGRKAKGLSPLLDSLGEVDQKHMAFALNKNARQQLQAHAADAQCTATTVLFAAYLEALCQCYNLDRLMFLTTVARTEPALASFAGNHTHKPVIPYQSHGKGHLRRAARTLGSTMVAVMAHLPADAGRHNSAYRAALLAAGAYPTQFSVLQPRPVKRQNQSALSSFLHAESTQEQQFGPFRLSPVDVSEPHRIFSDMELDVGAARTQRSFGINYDGISYRDSEISRLGQMMLELLDMG